MAVHAGGAMVVPLNGRSGKLELNAQIDRACPDVLVVCTEYQDKFTRNGTLVVIADGALGDSTPLLAVERRYAGQTPIWTAQLADVNGIKFTGGSSGVPKGVMQSFRCIKTLVSTVVMAFELTERDR